MARSIKGCRVAETEAGRVDMVVQSLTGLSRSQVKGLFDHDCVTVNDRPATNPAERVAAGDQVGVNYDPHTRYREKPRPRIDPGFRVLYEDKDIIVVEKAAFILTVPTDKQELDTLVQRVGKYLARGGRERRVHVVQRLDRGTSGVLVFAVTHHAAQELIKQFSRHTPTREYVALVAGTIREDKGTFESNLSTNKSLSRFSTRADEEGERAVTHFEVEARGPGATLVRVKLKTGRRNQIRVHFAEAGHPVLGDPRYRTEQARHPRWRARRLALHAAVLAFEHPVSGAALRFESPLPEEFAGVIPAKPRRGKAP